MISPPEIVIILFPFKAQLHGQLIKAHRPELDLTKPNDIVLAQCERHDVMCIDILPSLSQYQAEKLFWDYDPHFNKIGQGYASLAVEDALKQEFVIP